MIRVATRVVLAVLVVCCMTLSFSLNAQVNAIVVETIQVHDGPVGNSDLTGMTTYRLYAQLTDSLDFVGAVYGSSEEPINLSTTTSFFQHPAGGSFGTDLNGFFLNILPDLNYDSWLTIGLDLAPSGVNEEGISSIGIIAEQAAFEAGENFVLDSEVGGSWFVLPGSENGLADENLQVLLAQVTTNGLLSGQLNLQCFLAGNPFDEQLAAFEFSAGAPGCTSEDACNFDADANSDNGSCWFAPDGYNCDLECIDDTDGDGICDSFEVMGCEDPASCNFAEGITDVIECIYPDTGYDCFGACLADSDSDGICNPFEVDGCTDGEACNYDAAATDEDGSCTYPDLVHDCNGECNNDIDGDGICDELESPGCTDENADNFTLTATDDDGSCYTSGCMDPSGCDFDPMADTATSCTYPEVGYDCDFDCLLDEDGDGICDAFEVLGCTNPLAENFNPDATEDNGLCVVLPPSYCGEGTVWDPEGGQCISIDTGTGGIGGYGGLCFGDFDADGQRGSSDLLLWLGVYGYACD